MTMDDGDGNGPQPFASATYTTAGQLFQLSYGGATETRNYNSLLQLTSQSVPGYLNMTYTYAPGQNNGRIIGSLDGITGENTTYSYDALNRLTGASNSQWSETCTYDGFGNLTSKSGSGGSPNAAPSMSASYDANNHEVGSNPDGNGNSGGTRYFENRMVMQGFYPTSATWFYGYDPWGKRVMTGYDADPDSLGAGSDPIYTYNFYGVAGRKLATVSCNGYQSNGLPYCGMGASGQNVYFGRKLIVSGGVAVFTDRLGSVRANTQGEQFAYYPYGEERTNRPDGRDKFGTYFRDTAGQDYADQRYYGSGTGRFWSADPAGKKAADASNPTSWNRYAYAHGDPINLMDPNGTAPCGDADGERPCPALLEDEGEAPTCFAFGLPLEGVDTSGFEISCTADFQGTAPVKGPPPSPTPSMYLKETSACVDPRGNQVTPYYALEVTYQLYINGSAAFSNTQMSSFGINYISETLANATGNMAQQTPGKWCQGYIPAGVCAPGLIGTLNGDGTFTDILAGQGTLTQSFYINGTGAPLNVVFTIPGFVGPQQPLTALNNTYNSRGKNISVAGGLLTSNGLGTCK